MGIGTDESSTLRSPFASIGWLAGKVRRQRGDYRRLVQNITTIFWNNNSRGYCVFQPPDVRYAGQKACAQHFVPRNSPLLSARPRQEDYNGWQTGTDKASQHAGHAPYPLASASAVVLPSLKQASARQRHFAPRNSPLAPPCDAPYPLASKSVVALLPLT